MKPIKDLVLVIPINKARIGGMIILPDTVDIEGDAPRLAVVVSVGGDVTSLAPADKVIIDPLHTQEMQYQGEGEAEVQRYLFIREKDVMAIIEGD